MDRKLHFKPQNPGLCSIRGVGFLHEIRKKRLVKYAIFDGFIPIIDCESQFLTVKFIFSMVYPNF